MRHKYPRIWRALSAIALPGFAVVGYRVMAGVSLNAADRFCIIAALLCVAVNTLARGLRQC